MKRPYRLICDVEFPTSGHTSKAGRASKKGTYAEKDRDRELPLLPKDFYRP